MEAVSLSHPSVLALMSKFTIAMLDSDESGLEREVMVNRVADLPSVIFYSPTGTRLFEMPYHHRFNPGMFASSMRQALADLPKSLAREKELQDAQRAEPDSIKRSDDLTAFYKQGFRFEDASDQEMHGFRLAVQRGEADADRRMSEIVYYELKLRRFDRAAEAIKQFKEQFPTSPHRERVQYYSGLQQYYGPKDLDGAAKTWEEQLNEFPSGVWSGQGRKMLAASRALQQDRAKLGKDFPDTWGGK